MCMLEENIYLQAQKVIEELCQKAGLKAGDIVVVGCSTSEVLGAKIGTNSSPDTARQIFQALLDCANAHGFYLAIQCCEHLNRAIITERTAVPGAQIVRPAAPWPRRLTQVFLIPWQWKRSRQMPASISALR